MITLFCIRPKGFNVGNDAIFIGMQHFLSQAFGRVVNIVTLPATSRYESQAQAGLQPRTIHEINQYGHGVIIGGGNLYENGELEVNIDALHALQTPMMLFSLSRGRIYNRRRELVSRTDVMPNRTIQALNDSSSISLARDYATYDYLQQIGCERAQLGGCPTIFLDRMAERLPKLADEDRVDVFISIRNPALMNIPLELQSHMYTDVLHIIDFLRSKGHRDIRLLCHDRRDIAFASSFPGIDYVYTGDVFTYLAMLQSCKLNISYRLHASLPCLAFGTPTIKISYDERALSLFDTIGFGEWNIDLVRTDDVLEAVKDRYDRLDTLKEIRRRAQPIWDELYSTMATAFAKFAQEVKDNEQSSLPVGV